MRMTYGENTETQRRAIKELLDRAPTPTGFHDDPTVRLALDRAAVPVFPR